MGLILVESSRRISKSRESEIYQAAIFFLNELFKNDPDLLDQTILNINLVNSLKNKEGVYGDVIEIDDNEFLIRIDDRDHELFMTLAHELAHVYQYMSGTYKTMTARECELDAYAKEYELIERYSNLKEPV
jgi:hypothetical protein